jgi:hypothetical protein
MDTATVTIGREIVPTEHSPASSSDRPAWRDRLAERLGEDPGRWLDRDLVGGDPGGDMDSREWLRVRVDGLADQATVRAWIAAERRLGRGPDGGPREAVLELLAERERELVEIGDRDERVDWDAVPDRDERVDERDAQWYRDLADSLGPGESLAVGPWGSPAEQLARKHARGATDGESPLADEFEDFEDELVDGRVDRATHVGPTIADGGDRE